MQIAHTRVENESPKVQTTHQVSQQGESQQKSKNRDQMNCGPLDQNGTKQ